jgi:hypothetical protein
VGAAAGCLHSRSKSKVSFQLAPRVSFLDCDEGSASVYSSATGGSDPAALSTPANLLPTGSAAASSTGSNSYSGSGLGLSNQGHSNSSNNSNSRAGASSQSGSGAGALSALSRRGSTFGIAEQERAYAQRNSLEATQRAEVSAGGEQVQDSSGNGESPKGGYYLEWHFCMLFGRG